MNQKTATSIKPFLGAQFFLENSTAEILYHEYAAQQPIIDYHNHLPADQIANNKRFTNITEAWLNGDHYKWRAMRTYGIPEKYITGEAPDLEKFKYWAKTVPYTIRNPLFHWTHLELKRYFNINDLLNEKNAASIFTETSKLLQQPNFTTRALLEKMHVEVVCTTDDPLDDLKFHQQYGKENLEMKMLPAFRPDKAILIQNENFLSYINKLAEVADVEINSFDALLNSLYKRMSYFHDNGCRLSDHGLEQVYAENFTDQQVNQIFQKRLAGDTISLQDAKVYMSAITFYLSCEYAKKAWVQQFHLGALRNNNIRLLQELGPDTGFDSIGDLNQAASLSAFLNKLDKEQLLAKTILYNLNPRDNEVIASMIGNFNDGSVKGKMQYGSAWWFLDQKHGMEKQINALSNMGLLSCFIGMLTDSRSFLSFPRHEYFRRLLCNMIGKEVESGELPNDTKWLGEIVNDICYNNAKNYFDF